MRNLVTSCLVWLTAVLGVSGLLVSSTLAGSLNLAETPLYTGIKPPPMVMLVMGRDHTLYYEAYNDASDLDGDGDLDTTYKPTTLNYFGYFDSHRCYAYDGGKFVPGEAATAGSKTCTGTAPWSGDFLNYLSMSRMDALRAVLYGGYRSSDTANSTVLERVFIPQDAHSWGKSYTSIADNHYDLSAYTPFDNPEPGKKHFFATATFSSGGLPELRILKNVNKSNGRWDNFSINTQDIDGELEIWHWASKERPVLTGATDAQYTLRVQVCVEGKLESNCKQYPNGSYKPTGVLHDFGENGDIEFGLITGSYNKNLSGGVLRKAVGDFADEIDSQTGQFQASVNGIVQTIDRLRIHGFNYGDSTHGTNCGWVTTGAIVNGQCASWGNPLGEMLYESLRYFNGAGAASGSYATSGGYDAELGLAVATWDDPLDPQKRPYCAAPYNLLISDINPSYDSDELPGAQFSGGYQGSTLSGFSLTDLLDTISSNEGISGDYFIGDSLDDTSATKGAPTAKAVSSLARIRGLSPQEPTKEGSYSAAGVAYYGNKTDLFPDKPDKQNIQTFVVSLSSPLPEVKVDVDGQLVTIVPFAKSVGGGGINNAKGQFQPTNTIVDYYVESFTETTGEFRINFEDVEQGADHDMDMVVKYSYEVKLLCPNAYDDEQLCTKTKGVQLTLESIYAYGGIDQHAGYVVSGTTNDGIYLDVRDIKDNEGSSRNVTKIKYYLDTPNETERAFPDNSSNASSSRNGTLPLLRKRNFFPNGSSANSLPSPLWFAAKWGGFDTEANHGTPVDGEWDSLVRGQPDGYFPVTNAGELGPQLDRALKKTQTGDYSASAPVFNSNFLRSDSALYQSSFENKTWSGDVKAFPIDPKQGLGADALWSAAAQLDEQGHGARRIYSRNPDSGRIIDFVAPASLEANSDGFSANQIDTLLAGQLGSDEVKLAYLDAVVNFLRGDRTYESADLAYSFRERESSLGDVIHSTPYYVATASGHRVTLPVLVFGANDGMVHVLDASNGEELMAYVPSQVYQHLTSLTRPNYNHKYFVDGGVTAYTDASGTSPETTVVGSLGTGAKGLYAIDVSDMNSVGHDNIKWEITASGDFSGLGYSRATPSIIKLANGKVGVIFANGYNADESEAKLYIADLEDGSLIATLNTGVDSSADPTGASRPNALASPAVVDLNGDGIADRIYAGDLFGNMWAFDVSAPTASSWGLATTDGRPLFKATSPEQVDGHYIAQAITSRPSVGVHPRGLTAGVLVAFGTGKYIENSDNDSIGEATQSVYAIWDKLNGDSVNTTRQRVDGAAVYDGLLGQVILEENADGRDLSAYPIDWDVHRGWYLDLLNTQGGNTNNYGERQVTESLLVVNKLSFTTLLPNNDSCSPGGSGWYMEMNLHSGRTLRAVPVTGLASSPTVVIVPPETDSDSAPNPDPDPDPDPGPDPDRGSGPTSPIVRNCITLNDGSLLCFDEQQPPIGRLSLRALY